MAHVAMLFIVLPLYLCISLNFDLVHYTLLYLQTEKTNKNKCLLSVQMDNRMFM